MKPRLRLSGYLAAMILLAILGTLWDQLHVRSGTLSYTHPSLYGQPWWVPPEFGIAGIFAVIGVVYLGDPIPKAVSGKVTFVEGVWFSGAYALTAFFDKEPWIVFAALIVLLLVRAGDLSSVLARNLAPALALMVLGPLAEAIIIQGHLFTYRTHQIGPIPAWLPLLYANGFLFMLRATEALLQRFGVRRVVEPATSALNSDRTPYEQ